MHTHAIALQPRAAVVASSSVDLHCCGFAVADNACPQRLERAGAAAARGRAAPSDPKHERARTPYVPCQHLHSACITSHRLHVLTCSLLSTRPCLRAGRYFREQEQLRRRDEGSEGEEGEEGGDESDADGEASEPTAEASQAATEEGGASATAGAGAGAGAGATVDAGNSSSENAETEEEEEGVAPEQTPTRRLTGMCTLLACMLEHADMYLAMPFAPW